MMTRPTKSTALSIDKVSAVFGKQPRSQTTADEHKMYTRIFDAWLMRGGFGSYFEVDVEHGRCIAVRARRRPSGEKKVIKQLTGPEKQR